MAKWCLIPKLADQFKQGLISGDISPAKLNEMSTKDRTSFLEKYVGDQAVEVNRRFERSLLRKNQNAAILQWAKDTAGINADARKRMIDRIEQRNKEEFDRVFNPSEEQSFLGSIAEEKFGVSVSREEAKRIFDLSKGVESAREKAGNDIGNPDKLAENLEYFKARKQMDDYFDSLVPSGNLRVLTGTIGRGVMLASIKSPVLNIGSNIEIGLAEAMTRRIAEQSYRGTDNQLVLDYMKAAREIYKETGYDISRMMQMGDSGKAGSRVLGDAVNTQGPGAVKKVGRVIEDVVFKNLMGAPDAVFGSAHFADSLNVNSLKTTKGNVQEARAMMLDAMRIEPQTEMGKVLREQALLDAQTSTWVNKSWASDFSLALRGLLNKASGDLRLGDYLMPFVKTPANVISTSADYAGLGAVKALVKTVDALRKGDLGSERHVRNVSRDLVRSGIGLLSAVVIASNLDDEDFVGAYDPARAQYEELRGSNYNAFRVGNKWISTDWLGPLSVPVSAIMYARKYGSTPQERAFQYSKGVLSTFQNLPGVTEIYDFVKSNLYKGDQSLEEMVAGAGDYILEEAYSRLVPSLIGDLAKATDEYQRETGGSVISSIQSRLPYLRKELPIKRDIFGREMKTEGPVASVLFGSRVKTERENAVINEIGRVIDANDQSITFTDWDRTSSKKLAQFRQSIGDDRYNDAKVDYGRELERLVTELIDTKKYRDMTDDERADAISGLDTKAIEEIFRRYSFTYKQEK